MYHLVWGVENGGGGGLVAKSCPTLATPWTVACQAPLFSREEFSRQEYWGRLPFHSPGGLPYPGIKPGSPALQADSLPSEPPGKLLRSICREGLSGGRGHSGNFCALPLISL